ncbi:MAG: hypothetical protein ACR2NW_09360 [Thermodesulfobacteriota bacterium]
MIPRIFLKSGALGLSILLLFLTFLQLFSLNYPGLSNNRLVNVLRNHDVNYNYRLAWSFYNSDDYKSAGLFFANSIVSNPLFSISFVDLSEINLEEDNYDNVDILLNRSYELTPKSFKLLWRMSIISLWIDNNDLALNILTSISKVDNNKVFDVAWRVFDDNDLIMNNLVNNKNIGNYLDFLIRKNKIEESFIVWDKIKKQELYDNKLSDKYMTFLIRNNKIAEAMDIWKDNYGELSEDSLVWNGGFEKKPVGTGFGWKIDQSDSVFIGYDWEEKKEGSYSLHIIFNGKENVDFRNVSKVIPVEANSYYNFSSYIKTRDVTTTNGIFWQIQCFPDRKLLSSKTKILNGTNDWEKIEQELFIPEGCGAIQLVLRRNKSNKLNKLISGNVWIDDVKIVTIDKNEENRS